MNRHMVERRCHIPFSGGSLAAILHLPSVCEEKRTPCVIASHGLFSTKESEKLLDLAAYLTLRGIGLLRYDSRGCGESDGYFEETTPRTRVEDLSAVLDWIMKTPDLDRRRIGLMGSSMGGFASLCVAAERPYIKAVTAWAPPVRFKELHHPDEQPPKSGEDTPPQLGEEFYRTMDRPDLLELAPEVRRALILHGEKDETVPAEQSRLLVKQLCEPKRLVLFPGGDHRFSDPANRRKAIELTFDWFLVHLLPGRAVRKND